MRQATRPTSANPQPGEISNISSGELIRVLIVGLKSENSSVAKECLRGISNMAVGVVETEALPYAQALLAGETFHIALFDLSPGSEGARNTHIDPAQSLNLSDLRTLATSAAHLPVIALGPTYSSEAALSALEAGAEDFLAWDQLDARGLGRAIIHACERKKAESDLRISEVQFRALFEQSPNPICIHRSDGLSSGHKPGCARPLQHDQRASFALQRSPGYASY